MRRPSDRSARCRAVLAVAALYGLLLQVFLVSLHPGAPLPGGGVICAAHDGVPADDGTPCPQQLCCLSAHLAQPLAAPVPDTVAVAVPWRRAVAEVWRPAETPPARGPPDRAVSSRGPPAA
ncbi:hypothetical protein [Methylobacterium persicinum]|uniref:DUF2946 domain-containing protein n=1 Tax=Methylobacterium persicinum TaxID=374426 RepID=A0ABU0HN70_9HYPH|nr:hypothetical protein [Methylobacterium persicinum]MDQ0443782.1 hypothetical protein [Methylobacterium persicinum]GJE37473.1 hypothetical protein KHHGKMAE_1532 [Methylobacterium persicinum]